MLTFEQPYLLLLFIPIGLLVFFAWRTCPCPSHASNAGSSWVAACCSSSFICALAGAAWAQPVTRQSVVFVGDISASTGTQKAFIEQWITNAIKHKGPNDQVGIVAVGRNALVEQSVRTSDRL